MIRPKGKGVSKLVRVRISKGLKKEKGRGKSDDDKVPLMKKVLFNSFIETLRKNVAKWRAFRNSGKEMKMSDFKTSSKTNDKDGNESDDSSTSTPLRNGKKRKEGRKQGRMARTTPSGLPSDTIEVKLRSDTE